MYETVLRSRIHLVGGQQLPGGQIKWFNEVAEHKISRTEKIGSQKAAKKWLKNVLKLLLPINKKILIIYNTLLWIVMFSTVLFLSGSS